jgi:hypothetical protein
MQGLCPTRKRKKERKHHEQSHTPRTYHKGVPTCRGIKTDAAAGEGNLSNPLSLLQGTPTEQLQETTKITIKNKHNHEKDCFTYSDGCPADGGIVCTAWIWIFPDSFARYAALRTAAAQLPLQYMV